jgi:elongator complex protein 3
VDYHMMPQLPGATPESDYLDIKRLFDDPDFRPDMIKLYPTVVVPLAELYDWWKRGDYKPYADAELAEMLIRVKSELIPPYCRISRLIRDIPSTSIAAGNAVTNLREQIQRTMKARGLKCRCLRCREIGHVDPKFRKAAPKLFDLSYEASGGTEHFLSFEDRGRNAVFAFCRLRLAPNGIAFIRELHTYGHLIPLDEKGGKDSQHTGLGKKLMAEAERIARAAGHGKMSVISGVGVRGYYRKIGYRLKDTYMVKPL